MNALPLSHKIKQALQGAVQLHGWKFPAVLVHRAVSFGYRRAFGPKTFEFQGKPYRYFIDPYFFNTERTIELPIIWEHVRDFRGEVLEIGNVLAHYFPVAHDVVDKYEQAPGVMNEDVVTYSPNKKYDLIVTISTLEHVGWDENPREEGKLVRAIEHLKTLLKENGRLVVTMPFGYNPNVDLLVEKGQTGLSDLRFMKRISSNNCWRESSWAEVRGTRYNLPFPCGNAVLIGSYSAPGK
jgi:hypothetical protein